MISFKTLKITIIFSLFFLLNTQLLSADEAINIDASQMKLVYLLFLIMKILL